MDARELAEWLVKRGVSVVMRPLDSARIAYEPEDGFYKSDGCVHFSDHDGAVLLTTRYENQQVIGHPLQLVRESREWHNSSRERLAGWNEPPAHWSNLYAMLLEHETSPATDAKLA